MKKKIYSGLLQLVIFSCSLLIVFSVVFYYLQLRSESAGQVEVANILTVNIANENESRGGSNPLSQLSNHTNVSKNALATEKENSAMLVNANVGHTNNQSPEESSRVSKIDVVSSLELQSNKLIASEQGLLRSKILKELSAQSGNKSLGALADYLLFDPDPVVRRAAAVYIGKKKDTKAIVLLQNALSDADDVVRLRAVKALGGLKNPQTIDALQEALWRDNNPQVRRAAARYLGQIGGNKALVALQVSQGDDNETVRKEVDTAIKRIQYNWNSTFWLDG